ncbi:MAG: class I SAM-dependent methyltransferase [Chrysiogenia bacterium]
MNSPESVIFSWTDADFQALLGTCVRGHELPFIVKYLPKNGKIVDAGCGTGRYVVFLSEMGFEIEGIEINPEVVSLVKKIRPGAAVLAGDASALPYADGSIAGVISLGVVEHFPGGPEAPLQDIWRVLRPGHHAVITVPSFNLIRKMKAVVGYYHFKEKLKNNRLLRRWLKKDNRKKTADLKFRPFHIYKENGKFFEYRFGKKEFELLLEKTGFLVIESVPIAHMDGIYHEFGQWLVSFRDWQFHPKFLGLCLNRGLSRFPFFHNHMHLCVVKKPLA